MIKKSILCYAFSLKTLIKFIYNIIKAWNSH